LRFIGLIILILFWIPCNSQSIRGRVAFNFLKLSADPMLTGAGGINTSYVTNEVGLTANNPSLLHPAVNAQLLVSFSSFLKGVKSYNATGAYYNRKTNTTFGGHINFIDYGSITQTDASGVSYGYFRPIDFVIQFEAARTYLENWSYGVSLKMINSIYNQYKASGIAFDVGVLYKDSLHNFSASLLAKNMGFQIENFGGENEDLPFDIQVGISKRLQNAPLGISLTAYHINKFNLTYKDTLFNMENGNLEKHPALNNILNHFVIAGHIYLSKNLEAVVGYNHLRRMELNTGLSGNGLNGFSTGLKITFQNLQVLYARSVYQRNVTLNQIGINLGMNSFFSSGNL
jgi:hypothetical protein